LPINEFRQFAFGIQDLSPHQMCNFNPVMGKNYSVKVTHVGTLSLDGAYAWVGEEPGFFGRARWD
jgi:hypothetical protein